MEPRSDGGKEAHEIGEELRRREGRLKRIAEAKLKLEEEARRGREAELRQRAEELRSRAGVEADRLAVTFVCMCSNLLKLVNVPLSIQAAPA